MRSNKLLLGCGIAIIAALVVVIAGIVAGKFLIPDVTQQLPSGSGSTFVNVTLPVNGATLPLNQPVTVFVEAFGGQTIQSIELMVDGAPLPNGSPTPAGGKKMMSTWSFTPDKEGVYTLIGSAKTVSGLNSISNAVNINIVPADQIPLPLVQGDTPAVPVNDGESIEKELAEGKSAPPPPGFNGEGGMDFPPPPPMPDDNEAPDEPAGDSGGSLIPIKYSFWAETLSKHLIGFDIELPYAPKLDGGAKQCDAVLVIQDNSTIELGFFLYRLDEGHQLFQRVATLDAAPEKGTFSYHDPGLEQGSYTYYLAAFNSAGEAPGNVITVQIDDGQCAKPEPHTLDFDSLKMKAKIPVDKIYLYISADGSPWSRVPQGQNSFIQSVNGEFDLNPYLGSLPLPKPPQTEVVINIECWGWNGGKLTFLGSGKQSWKPGDTLVLAGEFFEIIGKGEGGYKIMEAKYKKTSRIAPPYSLHGSKDPNECNKYYSLLSDVEFCKAVTTSGENNFLFWVWHQYGSCNPGLQTDCDKTLQPADGFLVYTIDEKGNTEELFRRKGTKISSAFAKLPHCDNNGKSIYETYVVAYSEDLGESFDSNHINDCVNLSKVTIKPDFYETRYWQEVGDNSAPPGWYTTIPNKYLSPGYSFREMSGGTRDVWISGMVDFNLQKYQADRAQLNWKNMSVYSKGPGTEIVQNSCSVRLAYKLGNETTPHILPDFSFKYENYDVSQPVREAREKNFADIEFWFLGPDTKVKKVGVRPDECVWDIHEITLTIEKQPPAGP